MTYTYKILGTNTGTTPYDINDSGVIVGIGGIDGYGINNLGQVVGNNGGSSGFLDTGGTFTSIAVPSAVLTVPWDINDSSAIVGYYADSIGNTHGFLDIGGT